MSNKANSDKIRLRESEWAVFDKTFEKELQNPPLPEFAKWKKVMWALLGTGTVCGLSALSYAVAMQSITPPCYGLLIGGYAASAAGIFIHFNKLNKIKKAYRKKRFKKMTKEEKALLMKELKELQSKELQRQGIA